jgi:hypothetical protein
MTMTTSVTRVTSAGNGRTPLTALERRALADLTLEAECAPSDPIARCDRCWGRWVRARVMEHLLGERCWEEFTRGDFALLRRELHPNRELVAEIVAAVAAGSENLGVIAWAFDAGKPLEDVLSILAVVDVNRRRLPRFAWLRRAARCARAPDRSIRT